MSRTVVCYIERVAGGSLIARVRLVADGGPTGVDRSWTAPALMGPASGGSGGASDAAAGAAAAIAPASEAVTHARSAARWVADSLNSLGTKRLAMVCVDPDGAICTWLSAPSADPEVIEATLMQPDSDADSSGSGGAGGAARLLALGAGAGGGGGSAFSPGDASVQALATLENPAERKSRLPGRSRPSPDRARSRFAVLAVPDAPVRVFLDELDIRNVEVDQVVSLWHALAMAWDPGAPGAAPDDEDAGAAERVVASVSPAAAIVAVDPIGRLVWAWSQSGQLVAGGTMRLRPVAPASPIPRPAEQPTEALEPGAARRIGGTGASEAEHDATVEFSGSDAGRLALDWLSWSAQLGHCPQRVACIGPAPVPGASAPADPALIGQSIGELWPGATVGVAVHADPIGATLQRLLTRDIAQAHRRAADLSVATGSDDPRGSLVALSARPGRIDRRMYMWMSIGIAAVAVVVGVLGWQLHRAAGKGEAAIAAAIQARKDAIEGLRETLPQIVASSNFKVDLESEITKLKNQESAVKPPRPLLQEMEKVLNVISEYEDVRIERFTINETNSTALLIVPDANTGPDILEKIRKLPNLYMAWDGNVVSNFGVMNPGERKYNLNGYQSEAGARATGGAR